MRYDQPFWPIASTDSPGFNITLSTASTARAFTSASTLWDWQGPGGRSVRLSESSGVNFRAAFGTSDVTANSSACLLILGGTVELFKLNGNQTYIALMTTSTAISQVSVMPGYGR